MNGRYARPAAALLVALASFLLYRATLLPGFDLGDTASFQVVGGEEVITPRDGYPLYFALGRLFVWADSDRAHALNMASAAAAAVASGLVVLAGAELSGSVLAGMAAGALFAGSYTFWSQAVIAEVYALHMLLVSLTLWLLLRWDEAPSPGRLAAFFAAYALGFGNHLSMILLLPAYMLFLLTSAPGGWRSLLRPRVVVLAALLAAAGALQYSWNLHALWLEPTGPPSVATAARTFWFDVTKSDWRESMVLRIPSAAYGERFRMYAFDLRQQFGWAGPLLALCGLWQLARSTPRRAWLVFTAFLVNLVFALGYNVGDTHVFLLPSHLMLALLMAPGLLWLEGLLPARSARWVLVLALMIAGARMYRDYPALDRSGDTRPAELLSTITGGLEDRHTVLLADLNWQIQNGLVYFAKEVRPDVAFVRLSDVLLYAPALVADNLAIKRSVAVTERAKEVLDRAYGPLFETVLDPGVSTPTIADVVRDLPGGTRYVLSVLKPVSESPIDEAGLREALQLLTGGRVSTIGGDGYAAVAGLTGEQPALLMPAARDPFQASVSLNGVDVGIRMESWLAFDTIRRMGFGQVVAARRHALIIERGVSFVAFGRDGRPLRRGYASNIFAPQRRYLIRRMSLP